MPYLNRALAEEQMGVNAATSGNQSEAEQHYKAALRVCLVCEPHSYSSCLRFWSLCLCLEGRAAVGIFLAGMTAQRPMRY